jgi:spermidine synthase
MMFYHFTFLAIALALLGMAAGGVYVYARGESLRNDPGGRRLSRFARWCSVTTILTLAYALAFPISFTVETSDLGLTAAVTARVLVLTAVSSLPFFFAGTALSIVIARHARSIGMLYFFDLAGASSAVLVAGLLLGAVGAPGAALLAAVAAAMAAVLFGHRKAANWSVLSVALALLFINLARPVFVVPSVKTTESQRTIFEKWNVFSRVTVEKVDWGFDIKIDSCASTPIVPADAISRIDLRRDFAALVHTLFPDGAREVLVIGPGGGRDVVHALAARARHVTAVDINSIIVNDIMRDRFREASKGLYYDPRVSVEVEDGRSFVRRSERSYDVIQASMVDTFAASASGAFALTENTLYTTEAFQDYFAHLTDGGALTMSRWWGKESERLLVLAANALVRSGISEQEIGKHLYFVRRTYPDRGEFGTLIATRRAMTPAQIASLDEAAAAGSFAVEFSPGSAGSTEFSRVLDRTYRATLGYDLAPPTDDRPFFFYFSRPLTWSMSAAAGGGNAAVLVLIASTVALVALALGFIVLPMTLYRSGDLMAAAREGRSTRVRLLFYFAALGLGFIVVELGLIQRLTLFLGQPAYAFVVVLASLLASSSLGSLLSRTVATRHARAAAAIGLTVLLLLTAAIIALDPLLRSALVWRFPLRIALAGGIAASFGVPMGMMLPLGIRAASTAAERIVAWCWGINGAMSVIGTIGSTVVALNWGFRSAMIVAAASYSIAAGLMWSMRRMRGSPDAQSGMESGI